MCVQLYLQITEFKKINKTKIVILKVYFFHIVLK